MQFSDTTNKNGIIQYTESLTKLGDGGISSDAVLFKQITNYINQAYRKVAMALLRVDKNWKWDDSNYTDFPITTITMVDQQRDYALPASTVGGNVSTLWKLSRVRIADTSGLFHQIRQLSPSEEESQAGSAYSGVPTGYRLIGNSIRLSPIPKAGSLTLTNGLEIQFQRGFDEFTSADTTQQPGFIDAYHDLLAYDAAASYLFPYDPNLALAYRNEFKNRLEEFQQDYSERNDDNKNQIIPRFRSSR